MSHATPTADSEKPTPHRDDGVQQCVAGRWAVRLLVGPCGIRIARHTKVVDGDHSPARGHNEFLRLLRLAHYTIRPGPSLVDGSDVMQIDYNVAANPRPLRALVDEVQERAPGHLVGHGLLRIRRCHVRLFRFDMRREASSSP